MINREQPRRLLEALMDAMEREQSADSDETRAAAQVDVIKARDALHRASGVTDVERKRMMVDALGRPAGWSVDAADFERFADEYVKGSPEDENRLRIGLARHAQDSVNSLTQRWAGVFCDTMLQNYDGRYGALDGPANRQGVDKRGWPENVRVRIMDKAGYTAGVEFGAEGLIPRDFWKRVTQAQHAELAKQRGFKRHEWAPATARDHSQTSLSANVFRSSRGEGAAAKKDNKLDPSRMIS
jgi:hypothetical protein